MPPANTRRSVGALAVAANVVACALWASLPGGAWAQSAASPVDTPMARVIVSFKAEAAALRELPLAAESAADLAGRTADLRAQRLVQRAGKPLTAGRLVGPRAQVVMARGLRSEELALRLASDPQVAWAVPDQRRRAATVPTDPLFNAGPPNGRGPAVGQWYLRAPAAPAVSAIDAVGAWQQVSASTSLVVAVLDTGVLGSHPDLVGRVLSGYDTIADTAIANDGSGRDSDANDPGDWVTAAESNNRSGPFFECGASDSSWHGTQVAGLIGAIANNGQGIAGAAHGVRILPVRVLGKCGGYDSDILAGMYWAAGIRQAGLPANPTPARILNMSLGGTGACSAAYAEAVRTLNAQGAIIVAAAGNSAGLAVGTPANCPGVIGVAGLRHVGSKVGFSDLGPEITISAPGGNCVNIGANEPCLYPILTTADEGLRGPTRSIYTDSFNYTVGTSFSAPLVSATVALMLSADPALTPAEVRRRLQLSARPFPVRGADNGTDPTPVPVCRAPNTEEQLQCYCTTGLCGTGMLDAAAAVRTVLAPDAPDERARQLLNAAERLYPQYFPDRSPTQASSPFLYRFHPTTGVYLGVVVSAGAGFVLDGVYAMGGPFGSNPLYLGQLRDFITPGVLTGVQ